MTEIPLGQDTPRSKPAFTSRTKHLYETTPRTEHLQVKYPLGHNPLYFTGRTKHPCDRNPLGQNTPDQTPLGQTASSDKQRRYFSIHS